MSFVVLNDARITLNGQAADFGAFSVEGSASPGAIVVVRAQPRLLGNTIQQQTVANRAGRWRVDMNVSSIPFVAFPYVISAVEIVNGVQSDPASVEVSVR